MASDSYCNGCIYKGLVNGNAPCCNYIFMEDKRRPCPPGEGCTVKVTNRDAQRRTAEERKRKKLELAKEQRAKRRLARVHTVVCPICGKSFETDRVQARYCSKACAKVAHKAQLRLHEKKRREMDGPSSDPSGHLLQGKALGVR